MSTFLIFGATGGIGCALSKLLVSAGHTVVASGRDPQKLAMLSSELGTAPMIADATISSDVAQVFADTNQQYGAIQGVVNCVGSLLLQPAHRTSDADFAQVMSTNVNSAFYVLREATKAMMSSGGSIVLVSSAAARLGLANHEGIAAAKAAVIGLTLSAAATYASKNIRVNCVAPGLVQTPMTARLTGNDAALKASQAMHPLGRIGQPADVAAAIAFFLQPANCWVTGQVLGVDGGLADLKVRT